MLASPLLRIKYNFVYEYLMQEMMLRNACLRKCCCKRIAASMVLGLSINTEHAQKHHVSKSSWHMPPCLIVCFPTPLTCKIPCIYSNFTGTSYYSPFLPQFHPTGLLFPPLIVNNDHCIAESNGRFSFEHIT